MEIIELERNSPSAPAELEQDIFDYISSQTATFSEVPFCTEDSILFTQLAYLHLGGFVRGLKRFTLSVPLRRLAHPDVLSQISQSVRETEDTCRLLTMAAGSRRFGHVRVKFFEEQTDVAADKQFSAVTFLLDSRSAFIAYRGTDNTIVGWRENFNMAYMTPVPSQAESANYLRTAASIIRRRRLYVGGHSKGGNLAMYAAMNCGRDIQPRIAGVYNLDGPGFKDKMLETQEFKGIKDKLHIILPESSMIGTLLRIDGERKIVRSRGKGFDQHNPMNWIFDRLSLAYIPSLSKDAMVFDDIADRWLDTLDNNQRQLVVNVLFEIINNSGAGTFGEVIDKIKDGEITALRVLKDLDADTRKRLLPLLKNLGMEYIKAKIAFRKAEKRSVEQ